MARRDEVLAEITEEANSWPWCEWQFDAKKGTGPFSDAQKMDLSPFSPKLIWCGFRMIEAWEDGPTPRYLFSRLLERLSDDMTK